MCRLFFGFFLFVLALEVKIWQVMDGVKESLPPAFGRLQNGCFRMVA
jgi:hypothetical protein